MARTETAIGHFCKQAPVKLMASRLAMAQTIVV
jgi:hypothetical protein